MEDIRITKHKETIKSMYVQIDSLITSAKTFKDIFQIGATHGNHKIAFIYESKKKTINVTYNEYYENCYYYANTIKQSLVNIELGSYVGLKANNSIKWIYLFWGLIMAGYNPVLINTLYNTKETERLIKESSAKAIISETNEVFSVPTFAVNNIEKNKEKIINDKWGDKVAFCTSGTTGQSRIFVFRDENLANQIFAARKLPDTSINVMYKKDKGDLRLMAVVPFAHIYGFVAVFLWYTFFGMTIVFPKSNAANDIQECAIKHKISHIYGVPLLWDSLAKSVNKIIESMSEKRQELIKKYIDYNNHIITAAEAGFASTKMFRKIFQKKVFGTEIRFCVSGGASLSKDTLYLINGIGYPLNNGYGMTEVGVTSVETVDLVEQRLKGSIGFSLTNVEYKIIDKELCIKSPQIHSYTLVGGQEIPTDLDENGYFHTGDIGELDETEHAYLRGKKKDVIIGSNGENIYPDEVAARFIGIPFVNKYTVLGLKEKENEILTLVVSLEKELTDEEQTLFISSISNINIAFPNSMKVRKLLVSKNDLPVNTSMKLVKHEIIEDIQKNPTAYIELPIKLEISFEGYDEKEVKDIQNRIAKIASTVLGIPLDNIGYGQNFVTELGGDSFIYMSLIAELEHEFNITIPTEKIGAMNTINDVTLFILQSK